MLSHNKAFCKDKIGHKRYPNSIDPKKCIDLIYDIGHKMCT